MEFNLDESSLSILKNIFDWTDVDRDGKISREDLFKSLGLPSKDDAEQFFCSLKDLAGSKSKDQFLTFEEYCKGIMDYPSLINQFYQDFHVEHFTNFQSDESSERSSMRKSEIDFLPSKLKMIITHFNKILKQIIPEFESTIAEDLLEALRMCLDGLKHKSKSETLPVTEILNGSRKLYHLVRDLNHFNEKLLQEKNFEINDLQSQLISLRKKYDQLLEENDKLILNIRELEKNQKNINRAKKFASQEKKKLELELVKAEEKETDFKTYITQIESVIVEKEKEILRMEKKIRQLNSLKTLQEIKVSKANLNEENRLSQKRLGQSFHPKKKYLGPHKATFSDHDLNLVLFSNHLKKKSEVHQVKFDRVDDYDYKVQELEKKNNFLKEENEKLVEKIKRISQREFFKADELGFESYPSLFDEFQMIKSESESEYRGSVVCHYKPTPKMKDFSCQTMNPRSSLRLDHKDRGCFSWC